MGPRVRPEMVAAEHDARGIEPDALGDAAHEGHEIHGRHARVAAVLVDLVAGRLEQHECICMFQSMPQSGLDDDGMRAADGRHADGVTLLVARDEILHRVHAPASGAGAGAAGRSGSSTSSSEAASASTSPAILSGPGTAPANA